MFHCVMASDNQLTLNKYQQEYLTLRLWDLGSLHDTAMTI